MGLFHKKEKRIKAEIRKSYGKPKTETFDFDAIRRYSDRNPETGFQKIPEKTCTDLNFDDLFAYADRTSSKIGQQCLYNRMRRIPDDRREPQLIEKWAARLENNEPLRTGIQYHLQKLSGNDAYYLCDLFQDTPVKPPGWLPWTYFLSLTNLLALLLLIFYGLPQFLLLITVVTIVNAVLHYMNKKNIYTYLFSIPQLLLLNQTVKKLARIDFLRKEGNLTEASVRFLNNINRKMNFFRVDRLFVGDPFGILWGISEVVKIFFLLEPIFLFRLLRRIRNHGKELQEIFLFVGQVDEAASLASLRAGLPYFCQPEIIPDIKTMHFSDVYLPILPDCVPNTLHVNGKSILITGSNMSGKTTFIRTVGINALTGLTLNTCFARSFALPKLQLFSAILMNDDLMNDKSFYLEEVQTIKKMIDMSRRPEPHLFLLDEIYKGTNTVERVSGGKAVLSWLNRGNNLVFISTHDIELTELLNNEYDLYHFNEQVEDQNVSFDFKIKSGKMKTRNAIKILEVNGYPPELIAEAREISYAMDKQRQHGER